MNPSLGDGERPRGLLWRSALRPARADGINLPDSPFGGAEEAEFEAMLEEQEAAAAKARTSTRVRAQLATAAHAWRARRTPGTPRTATAAAAKATCTVRKRLRAPEPSAATLTPRHRAACTAAMCAELGICGCTLEDSDIQARRCVVCRVMSVARYDAHCFVLSTQAAGDAEA